MPQVRKIAAPITKPTPVKGRRGRPAGSKNKVKLNDTQGFEPETLYTYTAKDGCTLQSGLKSKTMKFTCSHGKPMELQK